MRFAQFYENTAVTNDGKIMYVNEGIDHIEALPVDEFIHAIENLSSFIASEKLDGANLVFGLDMEGNLYVSRESKRGSRVYHVEDWEPKPAWNGFKSAHAALLRITPLLKSVLKSGDAVECEVLFGRQPNAIVYGSSYIAFLRMVVGDNKEEPNQGKIKQLAKAVAGESISVSTTHITTDDGVKLKRETIDHTWKFVSTSFVDAHHFKKVDVATELNDLKKYLHTHNSAGSLGLTNGELMLVKLNSVPKHLRDEVKQARESVVNKVENDFKLPIKEKILSEIIRKLSPSLRTVEIHSHEDTGIEGVVFLDPKSMKQFKIVDKDVFTIINQFNFGIRNEIKLTGPIRQQYGNATLGIDGDIFGNMLKKIANVLGMPDLGVYTRISRVLSKFAGETVDETISNIAEQLASRNPTTIKSGVIRAVQQGVRDLDAGLQTYNTQWRNFRVQLKSGREISFTDEIHKRNLIVFAEVRQEMNDLLHKVQSANTINDVLTSLYGKQLASIHK